MSQNRQRLLQAVGIIGVVAGVVLYIRAPSFPTPDKLVIFLSFVFMIFRQATAMLKRLLPFVVLILVYESFRGVAHQLNNHVNYLFMPRADEAIFGGLPTAQLQSWLWHGHVQWYDFVFYLAYMGYFVVPLALAILIWKRREAWYGRFITAYLLMSFAGFLTFLIFPAAPPWLADQHHLIPHIQRISSDVWYAMGIHDFPSVYNHIAPNPVAAVPSLHAAAATLLTIFSWRLFGRKWGVVSLIYPFLIYVGTIYQGEHYAFDILLGIVYALGAYWLAPKLLDKLTELRRWLKAN